MGFAFLFPEYDDDTIHIFPAYIDETRSIKTFDVEHIENMEQLESLNNVKKKNINSNNNKYVCSKAIVSNNIGGIL